MFRDWDNFYLLVGGAGGALIGIMFVVATLTAGLDPSRVSRDVTPIVFHFAVVMVVSVITAVPNLPPLAVGTAIAFCAALGFAYTATTTVRLIRLDWEEQLPDWSDKSFYGILPTIAYVGLAAAACAVWFAPEDATYAIGAAVLVLLLIGIRNAWDLATTLTQRPRDQ
jgi:hypothetical protein